MNIQVLYFDGLETESDYTQHLRENIPNDIIICTRKDDDGIALDVSNSFYDEFIDAKYVYEHGLQVHRGHLDFGKYGNVVSIPKVTFVIMIPMKTKECFTQEYIESAVARLYSCEKPKEGHNDFMFGGRKAIGRYVAEDTGLYHIIGSLACVSEEIDGMFTDAWKQSGKILPSERIIGYREATGNFDATIEDFAEQLKFRINEQLKDTVQDIIIVDMDKEEK